MASSIPSQARAVDPFASYNSNTVNVLTRMLTNGEDGISSALSCDVIDSTSSTELTLKPGFVYMDDVWINISTEHTINFADTDHYYNYDTGFDEAGYYYIVLEYIYARSRPAPQAKIQIVKPSQIGAYIQGNSWLFLKAVKVEGPGPFHIVSVHNFDPDNPANKRIYIGRFAGTEVGLPPFNREDHQSRFVYGIEEDDFFFGFSNRWVSISSATGASYVTPTTGFDKGDLVYVKADGNLGLAIATLPSTTSDGVISKVGVDGFVQTVGEALDVKMESGVSVNVGELIYLSKSEPGKISNVKTTPFSQFVGRCIEVTDSTSANIIFHRGEAAGGTTTALSVGLPIIHLLSSGWIAGGGSFYQDVDISGVDERNLAITVWDSTSLFKVEPLDIKFISESTLRLSMPTGTEDLKAFIIGPSTSATIGSGSVEVVTNTLTAGGAWISSGSLFYQDVDVSSLNDEGSIVLVRDTATKKKVYPTQIQYDSTNNLRIWMPINTKELEVVAVGSVSTITTHIALSTILPSGPSWTLDGGLYFQEINISSFPGDDLVLEIYDLDSLSKIEPADIEYVSDTFVRIWMIDDTHQLNVTIIG